MLRLSPTLRAHDHLRDGRIHHDPIQRSLRTAVRALLPGHLRLRVAVRPCGMEGTFRRGARARRRDRVHHPGHHDGGWAALLRAVSGGADLRERRHGAHVGRQHARHGFQEGRGAGYTRDGRAVRACARHEYISQDRQAVLPQGHVGELRGVSARRGDELYADGLVDEGE